MRRSPSTAAKSYACWAGTARGRRRRCAASWGSPRRARAASASRAKSSSDARPTTRRGIGYVPDDRLIFPDLTVRENLDVGRKPPRDPGAKPWTIDGIYELFPSLVKLDRRLGGFLSGGEQQMLTIGRTLMGNPSVLLLDEPAEGLAPIVVRSLGDQILRLKQMGQTILLSEQNLPFAMRVADRAYVMSKGTIQFQGSIAALAANDDIKRQYLMV